MIFWLVHCEVAAEENGKIHDQHSDSDVGAKAAVTAWASVLASSAWHHDQAKWEAHHVAAPT